MIATIRWGLRVTPVMGALAVLGIVFLMTDPPRGKADGSHLKPTSPARQETVISWSDGDRSIKPLVANYLSKLANVQNCNADS
jgi:hypothetical protein